MSIFEIGAFLIGLSAVFGYLNYRFLRLPHTIGLVMIALVASLASLAIAMTGTGSWLLRRFPFCSDSGPRS